jgi:hypothetical protein
MRTSADTHLPSRFRPPLTLFKEVSPAAGKTRSPPNSTPAVRDLIFATYLGGQGNDLANGIPVDPAGYTDSSNFPVH